MLGDGNLASSLIRGDIEECLADKYVSSCGEEYINENFTNKIIPIPHKPKSIEVGTKVSILEIAKDIRGLSFKAREMIGKHGLEVTGTCDDEDGISYHIMDKVGNYTGRFPAYCVVPTELITQEVETEEMTLAEVCKELKRDIKIVK